MITDQYFAGLFDGEGYIGCNVDRRNGGNNISLRVSIGMSDTSLPLIMQIHAQYGGKLRPLRKQKGTNMSYIVWEGYENVEILLNKIEPYLVLKKEQAKLTLWWSEVTRRNSPYRYGIDKAREIFINDLRTMKSNMLLRAEDVVEKIERCFWPNKPSNIVSIR